MPTDDRAASGELAWMEVLAVLSSELLDSNGRPNYPEMFDSPALLRVLEQLQHCHAWVTCSGQGDAMQRLLEKYGAGH